MKTTITTAGWALLLFGFLGTSGLRAQETDAIIADFKIFSYFNSGDLADSLFYQAEDPAIGPVEYLEDTLDVFTEKGAFALNFITDADSVFIAIWVDQNANGTFEKEEQIYRAVGKNGNLMADVSLPIPAEPLRALIAVSRRESALAEPGQIPADDQISSLQFLIRGGPPGLTMTSKKDTREEDEVYCMTIPMILVSGPGQACITVDHWQLDYPVGNTVAVNGDVSLTPGGGAFAPGTTILGGDYFEFEFDFSAYPISDGDEVDFTLFYSYCDDPDSIEAVVFTFTVDCMVDPTRDPARELTNRHQLKVWPNPVRSELRLEYELDAPSLVRVWMIDLNGRHTIYPSPVQVPAGKHQQLLPTYLLPPGVYRLHLQTRRDISTKKIVILRP